MNNAKAIDIIKDLSDRGYPTYRDAKQLAIKALEKQIPQVVKHNNRHGDGYDYYNRDYFNCPACGRRLRNKQKDPYCGRCGQAIDWSR
jgi:predicted amidophosphoribosyltransferase